MGGFIYWHRWQHSPLHSFKKTWEKSKGHQWYSSSSLSAPMLATRSESLLGRVGAATSIGETPAVQGDPGPLLYLFLLFFFFAQFCSVLCSLIKIDQHFETAPTITVLEISIRIEIFNNTSWWSCLWRVIDPVSWKKLKDSKPLSWFLCRIDCIQPTRCEMESTLFNFLHLSWSPRVRWACDKEDV